MKPLVALFNRNDRAHARAVTFFRRLVAYTGTDFCNLTQIETKGYAVQICDQRAEPATGADVLERLCRAVQRGQNGGDEYEQRHGVLFQPI